MSEATSANVGKLYRLNERQKVYLIIFALAVGVLYDLLVWKQYPGLGLVLYNLFFAVGVLALSRLVQPLSNRWPVWLVVPIIVLNLDMLFYTNHVVTYVVPFVSLLLTLVMAVSLTLPWRTGVTLSQIPILTVVQKTFDYLKHLNTELRFNGQGGSRSVNNVVLGVVIALPLLVIFGWLFQSADPLFGTWLHKLGRIINDNLGVDLVWRILRTLLIFFIAGAFFLYLAGKEHSLLEVVKRISKPFNNTTVVTVFVLLNVLFAVFVFAQLNYLFGGEAGLAKLGVTYSEYARRGFIELVAVSALVLVLVVFIHRRYAAGELPLSLKSLTVLLALFTLVIGYSALSRNWMYQSAYGLTESRLYAEWLNYVLMLFVALSVPAILASVSHSEVEYAVGAILVASFCVIASLNAHDMIAKVNIDRLVKEGKTLDSYYLMRLSLADIAPEIPALKVWVDSNPDKVEERYVKIFTAKYTDFGADEYKESLKTFVSDRSDWREYNFSVQRAKSLFKVDN